MSKASKKTDRRITPLEHAQLKKDAAAVEAARDVIDDATVALNSAKAAADVVAVPAQRRAVALARRYKLKPNEEIDIESGVIQLKPPAPPILTRTTAASPRTRGEVDAVWRARPVGDVEAPRDGRCQVRYRK
jgi:hypothetical protein